MGQLIDLRNPGVLSVLRQYRMAVVAPVFDPAWTGTQAHVNRAYRVVDKREVAVPDVSILYLPQYSKDWDHHPAAHRALQVLLFKPRTPVGPVIVDWMRLNALFFFIPNKRVDKIIRGEQSELELLRDLEKGMD